MWLLIFAPGGIGTVSGNTAMGNPAPVAPTIVQSAGYVGTPAPPLATIFHTLEDHLNLIQGDRILIDAGANKHLQVGDQLTVFRLTTTVQHPGSAQALGTLVVTLGVATVMSVQATTATLQITQAFDAIEVGDYVKAFEPPPPVETPAALPARPTIAGHIAATKDGKVAAALGDIVYLDRGEHHGVALGDRFDVLQESRVVQHPISSQWLPVPRQVLGTLTVVDVRSRTAAALITASQREFSVGTPVERGSPPLAERVAAEPQPGAALVSQAEASMAQLSDCLNTTRQALQIAAATGVPAAELTAAQTALARAELLVKQAQQSLAQGDYEQAIRFLERAQADCLTAQELSAQSRSTAKPEQYSVQRGDTLWGISAKPLIYGNPLMWPLIYQANRRQIRDPDLIFPRQVLAVPRDYSQEQAQLAIQRARQRGRWRLRDGPDPAVLEGVQR
jgi:nucleoid-associated protein YgaU